MKDLSYTSIFPNRKPISHQEALEERVKSKLHWIMLEENDISEKSHSGTKKVIDRIDSSFTKEMLEFSLSEYSNGKRIDYISEILYDDHFKNLPLEELNESIVHKYGDYIHESESKSNIPDEIISLT